MQREDAYEVLNEWRNKWIEGASSIRNQIKELQDVTLYNLDDAVRDLESEAEHHFGNVPCEDGVTDFINAFADDSETLYTRQEVAEILYAFISEMSVVQRGFNRVRVELYESTSEKLSPDRVKILLNQEARGE